MDNSALNLSVLCLGQWTVSFVITTHTSSINTRALYFMLDDSKVSSYREITHALNLRVMQYFRGKKIWRYVNKIQELKCIIYWTLNILNKKLLNPSFYLYIIKDCITSLNILFNFLLNCIIIKVLKYYLIICEKNGSILIKIVYYNKIYILFTWFNYYSLTYLHIYLRHRWVSK